MQGTALRSQLRTNVPGHICVAGTLTVASGVPAVGNGTRFTVGRGVLSLTVNAGAKIVGAPDGTYTGVPITTTTGSTGVCSLTVAGGANVISAATVTAPGYDYTAANSVSLAVGSLFWTGAVVTPGALLTDGTYYVPIVVTGNIGRGMIARIVVAAGAVSTVTVNPYVAAGAGTAVGANYGTSALVNVPLAADALYPGSPAIANCFTLTPNPAISVATVVPVITGNFSVVYAGNAQGTVTACVSSMIKPGNTFFSPTFRYGGPVYANFCTLSTAAASATPSDGDGLAFQIITTDTAVTA